ncbi:MULTISPECIES: hypothetical protein [Haloferacaceae]|uniref:Uncharacterized protein n=1 Tax=Halorubrum glutamatedens TaxID=2707018 RepID=A0ABD5QNF4_9EURY|nr:hypothetical protein [Halobellus captivus]
MPDPSAGDAAAAVDSDGSPPTDGSGDPSPIDGSDGRGPPPVHHPEPETDRGLPGFVDASLVAFAVSLLALVVAGAATGDPVTWGDAPGTLSNALMAASVGGGIRWVSNRGG